VTSSKRFDVVVAAIKASIGHPNTAELWQATQRATTATELEAAIQPALGKSGLMQFAEFDHGMIVRKGTEQHTSKIIRLVIGNPLIMKEMAKRVRTPARMLRLPSSWMSAPMAFIFRMTRWRRSLDQPSRSESPASSTVYRRRVATACRDVERSARTA
jgi:hypothetical protein